MSREPFANIVMDWGLSDDEFIKYFRLPRKGKGHLADINPFPRENRVQFDEETHTYTIDGTVAPRSCTGLLHAYVNHFDQEHTLMGMQQRQNWDSICEDFKRRGLGVRPEDFFKRWAREGQVARMRGHLLHYHAECLANSIPVKIPHSPEFQQAQRIYALLMQMGLKPYRTEVNIFHIGLRCGGQPDLLCIDTKNQIVIVDWKRTKNLVMDNKFTTLKYPLLHLPECAYWKYTLQLNLYRYILESEYSMTVGCMFLAIVHPAAMNPRLVEVPRIDEEMEALVENEVSLGRASHECVYSDTRFSLYPKTK